MKRGRVPALLIFVCFSWIASPSRAEEPKDSPDDDRVVIATHNILFANRDLKTVAENIRKADADVVCLQETNLASEISLRRALRDLYPHGHFFKPRTPLAADGFGLLSKHPILESKVHPPEHGLFGTQIAKIDVDGQVVQVVNVHLDPMRIPRDGNVLQVIATLQGMESTHEKEIKRVVDLLDDGPPTVVCGDFNSLSLFKAPTFLSEHGFTDSQAAVMENADSVPTWHWPTKMGECRLRIDFLFHDDRFETADCRVIESDASDHFLVVAGLKLVPEDDTE